jgi:uncharacterized protein YutE (UPF0331/DUF86 family)
MTPRRLDPDTVTQKLAAIEAFVADLEALAADPLDLAANRVQRNVAERALIGLVDLAASVNAHLVAAAGAPAPSSYRESFAAVAGLGVLPAAEAARLERAAGLRNVLVHLYVAVDPAIVADAVPQAVLDFRAYVRAVAGWLLDQA